MKRVEMEGLIKDEHLELFMSWYVFGGMEKGLSLSELMTMPGDLLTDFRYILRNLGELRRGRKGMNPLK